MPHKITSHKNVNNCPFKLLLPSEYADNIVELFNVLEFDDQKLQFPNNKALVKTSFAFICMDYLSRMRAAIPNVGYIEFCRQMNFHKNKSAYLELLEVVGDDQKTYKNNSTQIKFYSETMHELITFYKLFWGLTLKNKHSNGEIENAFYTYVFDADFEMMSLKEYFINLDFIESL